MKVLPYGDVAVLLDCDSLAEAQSWHAAVAKDFDAVLGARSVLLRGDPARLRAALRQIEPDRSGVTRAREVVEIPVTYDGPDLMAVAHSTGLSEAEVIAAHTSLPWTVAFGGFAPGFAYLTGGDPRLVVPRLDTPRTSVPAGSVGLAGEFSGIYPRSSPGGWQLIGHTDVVLFDLDRARPALLAAGALVKFVVAS